MQAAHGRASSGRIERLHGQAEMVAEDVARRAIDPRNLGAQPAPRFREPPQERRHPGDAGLDQHHLEPGVLGEYAFADEARDLGLEALRLGAVVLDVDSSASRATSPDGDRRSRRECRSADRGAPPPRKSARNAAVPTASRPSPAPAPGRSAGRRRALDLLDGELDILQRHHDRGAQARVMIEPLPRNPVVDGAGEGARHVLVEDELDAIEAVADGKGGAPAVEHLGCERARHRSPAACPALRKSGRAEIGALGG